MIATLRAFHNDPAIQTKYVRRVEMHRAADEIVQGQYWHHGKGCAVGCTIHGDSHAAYETELGVPIQIAHLEDCIFEGLSPERAKDWPVAFITAIPLGADLSQVWPKFAAWLMTDPEFGVENITEDVEIKELCREVARCYLAGETSGAQAEALAERLRAAWAAREARAARAAWEAREAREAWEARAAWEAREAREAWEASREKFVEASADKLLMLLLESAETETVSTVAHRELAR